MQVSLCIVRKLKYYQHFKYIELFRYYECQLEKFRPKAAHRSDYLVWLNLMILDSCDKCISRHCLSEKNAGKRTLRNSVLCICHTLPCLLSFH